MRPALISAFSPSVLRCDASIIAAPKLAQKDRDARWTVKWSKAKPSADGSPRVDLAVPVFGYKNHVGIDRGHGLIRTWAAPATMGRNWRTSSHGRTPEAAASGPTRPTARRQTNSTWLRLSYLSQEATRAAHARERRPRKWRGCNEPVA